MAEQNTYTRLFKPSRTWNGDGADRAERPSHMKCYLSHRNVCKNFNRISWIQFYFCLSRLSFTFPTILYRCVYVLLASSHGICFIAHTSPRSRPPARSSFPFSEMCARFLRNFVFLRQDLLFLCARLGIIWKSIGKVKKKRSRRSRRRRKKRRNNERKHEEVFDA